MDIVLQDEFDDCGACCLSMIASHYNKKVDIDHIATLIVKEVQGVNLSELKKVSEKLGFEAKAFKIESSFESIKTVKLPCVIHWNCNHFVVLKEIKDNGFVIVDPSVGEMSINKKVFEDKFMNICLELFPNDNFSSDKLMREFRLPDLLGSESRIKSRIAILLLITLFTQLLLLIAPVFSQKIIDEVLIKNDLSNLNYFILILGAILITGTIFEVVRTLYSIRLSVFLGKKLGFNTLSQLLELKASYFNSRHMGDLIQRFSSIQYIRSIVTDSVVRLIIEILSIIICLLIMAYYDPVLTIIVTFFLSVFIAIRFLTYKKLEQITNIGIKAQGTFDTDLIETIKSIAAIKTFNAETKRFNILKSGFYKTIVNDVSHSKLQLKLQTLSTIIIGSENLVVLYYGAYSLQSGAITIGAFFAFMMYKSKLTDTSNNFVVSIVSYKTMYIHLERIKGFYFSEKHSKSSTSVSAIDPETLLNPIVVDGIAYSHSKSRMIVFENVSFVIVPKVVTVITGSSGCGKSTLLNCIAGLEVPSKGKIIINGEDISKLPSSQRGIALVSQNDNLLSGTIIENISFFETQIDMERAEQCARMACIHSSIMNLPLRYNTSVSNMGANFSGGQVQRILIARALYTDPKILLLDEATSQLDLATEKKIYESLMRLGITMVIVSHRPETMNMAKYRIDFPERT